MNKLSKYLIISGHEKIKKIKNTSVFLQRSPGKPHFLFMISHHTYPAGFTLWPGGTYGLPKALSGCPSSQTFRWQTGWRFQDSEGVFSDNAKSAEFHLDGWVSFTGVNRSFCIKPGGDVNTTGWQKGERFSHLFVHLSFHLSVHLSY